MISTLEALSQNITVDLEKCIFCGRCMNVCIMDNLRLNLAPCRKACPMGLNCQGYIQLIARGEEEKAFEVIKEDLLFPGILGRICHHPCETACNRNQVDGSGVDIKNLKRYLADTQGIASSPKLPIQEREQKVAVVGGGPAGLMAACTLRESGYKVTIYESESCLGGMLANCIPEFRLPEAVVIGETGVIAEMGIEVIYNTKVGKDIGFDELLNQYDAVIVSIGKQQSKKLGLAGEEAENVYNMLDFLRNTKKSNREVSVGKKVLVIGGGNTAVDAAQTAYRLGAEEIRIVCLENSEQMPAYKWEVEEALKVGIIIEYGWGPEEVILNNGKVSGVKFKRCTSVLDLDGCFSPQFSMCETLEFLADTVIVAIGQEIESGINLGLNMINGCLASDILTKQSSIEKVFIAGDATFGPNSVVDAMAQGKAAAESVHRFILKFPLEYARDRFSGCELEFDVDLSGAQAIPRINPTKLEGKELSSFNEVESFITQEQAVMEAKRCLSCGEPYGKFRTCWSCLPCEVECPQEALRVKIPYLMR